MIKRGTHLYFLALFFAVTSCFAQTQTILSGCEAPTGTDSSEFSRLFGPDTINPAWVRIQCTWGNVETSPGVYDWTAMDRQIRACRVANLRAINWPHALPAQPKLMFCICWPSPWYTNSTATQSGFIAGETNFIKAALTRYHGAFQWLEPVNEPDGGCNWIPGCSDVRQNAQFTAKLLAACRSAARFAQPGLLIAGPSNSGPEDTAWNTAFEQAGGFGSCDVVTWHDYRMNPMNASPDDSVRGKLRSLATDCQDMKRFGQGKPMMITELGLGSPSNAVAYAIVARRGGVTGIAPVGIMAPGPLTYWDWTNDTLTPAGRSFFSTLKALNHPR